jgi:hypothetical protein
MNGYPSKYDIGDRFDWGVSGYWELTKDGWADKCGVFVSFGKPEAVRDFEIRQENYIKSGVVVCGITPKFIPVYKTIKIIGIIRKWKYAN